MGPAAWAAVGRALSVALTRWALDPQKGGAALVMCKIEAHISTKNFALARAQLAYLRDQHKNLYDKFIEEFGEDLPPEFL